MINNKSESIERPLMLGDYVTVHVAIVRTDEVNNAELSDMQVHREALFQRIQKQRGEICRRVKKREGTLVDPRHRASA